MDEVPLALIADQIDNSPPIQDPIPVGIIVENYKRGQIIEVLDMFTSTITGKIISKWRECMIIRAEDTKIMIHFIGWPGKFDMYLDTIIDQGRIRRVTPIF